MKEKIKKALEKAIKLVEIVAAILTIIDQFKN